MLDGSKEVKLVATNGRKARVGSTAKGPYAEMIAYGVENMMRIISKPSSKIKTIIVASSVKERQRNTEELFKEYMTR